MTDTDGFTGRLKDPYYAGGQAQGGAAWHAVKMARDDREAEKRRAARELV